MDKSWRTPSGSLSIRPSFRLSPLFASIFPLFPKKRLILRLAVGRIDFRRNALQFHSSQVYRCSYVLSHRTRETSQRRVSKSASSWKYRVCSQFFYAYCDFACAPFKFLRTSGNRPSKKFPFRCPGAGYIHWERRKHKQSDEAIQLF